MPLASHVPGLEFRKPETENRKPNNPCCPIFNGALMVEYSGGDGSSKEKAIIITGAANSMEGIAAEYQYLADKYGARGTGWNLEMQSLMQDKGKSYDLMRILLKDGTKIDLFFDITEFFGK